MKSFFAFLGALLIATSAWSQETASPDVLIKNVTNEVLEVVRKDKEIKGGNTRKAVELVETKVLPYFNFSSMTKLAMGRSWNTATPAQQKILTDEFRTLLVRTYSKALTEYKNQSVDVKPMTAEDKKEDRVRTEIKQPGGQPLHLDYFV
jgi:phospholipid transport system substrate-binding protein